MSRPLFSCLIVLCAGMIVLSGCSTTIRSYPVQEGLSRRGGIPYFMPKPLVLIREPIEMSRTETLFAVIDISGLETFMYELKPGALDEAIEKLKGILGAESIEIEEKISVPFFLSEETSKKKQSTGQHQSTESEQSKKYVLAQKSETKQDTKPAQKPADLEKALSLVWIPDASREYELMIAPSKFAGSDLTIKLADGWRLESISAKTGDNPLIEELGETLRAVIGAQRAERLAEIAGEQALKLKELELRTGEPEEKIMAFGTDQRKAQARVVCYVKKTTVTSLLPGLHELMIANGSVSLPQETTVMWERIQL